MNEYLRNPFLPNSIGMISRLSSGMIPHGFLSYSIAQHKQDDTPRRIRFTNICACLFVRKRFWLVGWLVGRSVYIHPLF
jgi:hypothetical protein